MNSNFNRARVSKFFFYQRKTGLCNLQRLVCHANFCERSSIGNHLIQFIKGVCKHVFRLIKFSFQDRKVDGVRLHFYKINIEKGIVA